MHKGKETLGKDFFKICNGLDTIFLISTLIIPDFLISLHLFKTLGKKNSRQPSTGAFLLRSD